MLIMLSQLLALFMLGDDPDAASHGRESRIGMARVEATEKRATPLGGEGATLGWGF